MHGGVGAGVCSAVWKTGLGSGDEGREDSGDEERIDDPRGCGDDDGDDDWIGEDWREGHGEEGRIGDPGGGGDHDRMGDDGGEGVDGSAKVSINKPRAASLLKWAALRPLARIFQGKNQPMKKEKSI